MDASHLLKWHYLVFWLPFAVGALLLALSMLSMGDGDGDSDRADGADSSSDGDGGDADHSGDGDGADGDGDGDGDEADGRRGGAHHPMPLLALLGAGKAPTSIVLEAFAMSWGFAGFWANQLLLGGAPADPEFAAVLPSLGIALGGGAIGARGAAEMIHRLLPKTETSAVSRNSLLMRTGKVLFAVTETTGRLRVYDEHGTLHEHPCRVRPGTPEIAKGKTARVIDIDPRTEGLIVEEAG